MIIFMIVIAFLLQLSSSWLTAEGIAVLFTSIYWPIFAICVVIDVGRFALTNYMCAQWVNLHNIKWFILLIVSSLLFYSAVGIYNKLDSSLNPYTFSAINEVAYVNLKTKNALQTQNDDRFMLDIAKDKYETDVSLANADFNNCILRFEGDLDKKNNCFNVKARMLNKAKKELEQASAISGSATQEVVESAKEVSSSNKAIAGILTTVCNIKDVLPGTSCDSASTVGLRSALSICFILMIISLDWLQLSIVLLVNTRKNKIIVEDKIDFNTEDSCCEEMLKEKTKVEDNIEEKKPLEDQKNVVGAPKCFNAFATAPGVNMNKKIVLSDAQETAINEIQHNKTSVKKRFNQKSKFM